MRTLLVRKKNWTSFASITFPPNKARTVWELIYVVAKWYNPDEYREAKIMEGDCCLARWCPDEDDAIVHSKPNGHETDKGCPI